MGQWRQSLGGGCRRFPARRNPRHKSPRMNPDPAHAVPNIDLDAMLRAMLAEAPSVSDLLFVAGKPPQAEQQGKLQDVVAGPFSGPLTGQQTAAVAKALMRGIERLQSDLDRLGGCDTSYAVAGLARFRVNVFKQNGNLGIVMRKLSSEVPNLDKLGLPQIFREIIKEKTGIVFVTGATGSGKTTTLAAMLNELNQTSKIHVVTLEDPIEFLHPHKSALFSQRELGKDFPDFASGLRSALRQAPKVILVGEIRDRETMEIALTASETGHLVFSTLHTVNAGQTINRVLGMFTQDEEQQIRERLAETLRYVVSQRLVPKVDGKRLLVSEIMGSNLRTREVLLYGENETRNYQEIIEAASVGGWHTFDQSLLRAYERGDIVDETVMLYCNNKNKTRRDLDTLKKKMGAAEHEGPSGLRLEEILEPQLAPPPLPRALQTNNNPPPAFAPKLKTV